MGLRHSRVWTTLPNEIAVPYQIYNTHRHYQTNTSQYSSQAQEHSEAEEDWKVLSRSVIHDETQSHKNQTAGLSRWLSS